MFSHFKVVFLDYFGEGDNYTVGGLTHLMIAIHSNNDVAIQKLLAAPDIGKGKGMYKEMPLTLWLLSNISWKAINGGLSTDKWHCPTNQKHNTCELVGSVSVEANE